MATANDAAATQEMTADGMEWQRRMMLLPYYCCTTAVLLLYYCCTTAVLLLYYCCTTAVLLLYYCCTTAVLLLYYCCTAAVLLLYCCCTTAVLLLYYCCTTAVLLLYHCCTTAVLLLYCCCTAAVLLLYYCCTTAVLLLYYQNHSTSHSILSPFSTSCMQAFDPLHACCPQTPCDESDKYGTSSTAHHIHIGIRSELGHHVGTRRLSVGATHTSTCARAMKCALSNLKCVSHTRPTLTAP